MANHVGLLDKLSINILYSDNPKTEFGVPQRAVRKLFFITQKIIFNQWKNAEQAKYY